MSGVSDVNEPVLHSKRCVLDGGVETRFTYAEFQQMGTTSCRLCGLCVKILEAFANGEFPALFQGVDEARRNNILQELSFRLPSGWNRSGRISTMLISFRAYELRLSLTQESDGRDFAIEGLSFRYPGRIDWHSHEEEAWPHLLNTQYSDSFERANTWLQDCLEHHDCGKSDFYPKRLLDLRRDKIRLFETNEVKNFKAPYVCLSHRWGSSGKRLTSTVVNVDNHMNGIPWEEIPRTFRDDIAVCKQLSVSYLWIDTVCILQEFEGMSSKDRAKTEADFAAENSAMARIYQNSQLTICASMSRSMDSGMFTTKYDHRINVTADDGNEASLRVSVLHSHETPPTELETRGWTYQEYLLPPRILEFGSFDISWRCQRGHFCECGDGRFTVDRGWRGELAIQTRPGQIIQRKLEQWWIKTVQHYTGRDLTNHQDKLPALSGLAQMYREVMDDTYLAGLWKASLPYNLCWYLGSKHKVGMTTGIGRRPRQSRAPSWSWASIDASHGAQCHTWWPGTAEDPIGRTYYILDEDEDVDVREVCTIYEATVEPQTSDPFGRVFPGGFLELGVTLIPAKIDTKAQGDMVYPRVSVAWTLNQFDEDDIHVFLCLPDCELEDNHLKISDELDENFLKLGDEVYCAPIVETSIGWWPERGCLGCLVLKWQKGQEYQRVGFCILQKENLNFNRRGRDDGEKLNTFGKRIDALLWPLETETRIKIV